MSNLGKYQDLTTRMKESGGVDEFFEEHDEQIREECRKEHEEQLREEHAKGFSQGCKTTAGVFTGGLALYGIANIAQDYHGRKMDEKYQKIKEEWEHQDKLREARRFLIEFDEQMRKNDERLEEIQKRHMLEKTQDNN